MLIFITPIILTNLTFDLILQFILPSFFYIFSLYSVKLAVFFVQNTDIFEITAL